MIETRRNPELRKDFPISTNIKTNTQLPKQQMSNLLIFSETHIDVYVVMI